MTEIRPVVWTEANKETIQVASDITINPGEYQNFDLEIPLGKTGMAVTVNVTYSPNASDGAEVRIYHSPDGVNWDTDTDEIDTVPFRVGETVQKTFIYQCILPYVRIVVVNKDTSQALALNNLWVTYI